MDVHYVYGKLSGGAKPWGGEREHDAITTTTKTTPTNAVRHRTYGKIVSRERRIRQGGGDERRQTKRDKIFR